MNRLGKYIAELEAELAAAKDLEARTRTIHPEPEPLPSIRLASDAGRAHSWFMRSDLPPEKLPVIIADEGRATFTMPKEPCSLMIHYKP